MAELKLTGVIKKIFPTEQATDTFKKRKIAIEDTSNPKFPEIGVFDFVQDKCALLDNFRVGDTVTIDFNVRGRAYQKPGQDTNYFCSLQGWRIERIGGSPSQQAGYTASEAPNLRDDGNDPF